jgi:hypothetical protein
VVSRQSSQVLRLPAHSEKRPIMNTHRQALLECLARLAADPDAQIAYLRNLGVYPLADELALEFHEAALLCTSIASDVAFNPEACEAVRLLDSKLGEFGGSRHCQLWTAEALRSAPEWIEVRALADKCLKLIDG